MQQQRLQKYLADRGIVSRRGAVEIIQAGRVAVNGSCITEPGFRVDADRDVIALDGKALPRQREQYRTVALNKPSGYICSRADAQGPTIFALLPGIAERIVPVGRLDKESEGLLLLSNDGALVERLTHPRFGHAKTYEVDVNAPVSPALLERLGQPFEIEGYHTRPAQVQVLSRPARGCVRLEFILHEGRNRQIRHMCRAVGLRILRLRRTRIGGLTLGGLKPGQWRDLSAAELRAVAAPP